MHYLNPLVSVLIPTKDRGDLVVKAVVSALCQSYKNLEIIVGDNCSSYDIEELFKWVNDPRVRIYRNPEDIGPIRNWRRCLEESKGKYCVILPDDDYLMNPFYIEDAVKLAENNNVPLVITDCVLGYPQSNFIGDSGAYGIVSGQQVLSGFNKTYKITTIANLFDREIAKSLDAFNDNSILYSDLELWFKILARYKVYFYNKPSVYYRFHSNNIVTNMTRIQILENSAFISLSLRGTESENEISNIVERYIELIESINGYIELGLIKRIFYMNDVGGSFKYYFLKNMTRVFRRYIKYDLFKLTRRQA